MKRLVLRCLFLMILFLLTPFAWLITKLLDYGSTALVFLDQKITELDQREPDRRELML